MLFLPKNTSISNLVERLLKYHKHFMVDESCGIFQRKNELLIEIEQLVYGNQCKVLLISLGNLVKITGHELQKSFVQNFTMNYGNRGHFSNKSSRSSQMSISETSEQSEGHLNQILSNLIRLTGMQYLTSYISYKGPVKISLEKVTKQVTRQFSDSDWEFVKKFHKKQTKANFRVMQ